MREERTKASEEQIRYANILNIGMYVGLLIIGITFILYLASILPPFIPLQELPNYWTMRSADFIHTLHTPTGWDWVFMLNRGDYLNLVGIAILAGLTILCYIVILPVLVRKKDKPYIIITILEVIILVFAASGILKSGGH